LWVIYVLVGLLLFILLVLSVPVDFRLSIDIHGSLRFSLRITWLFRLISWDLWKEKKGTETLPEPIPLEKQPEKKGGWGRIRPDSRSILSIFRTKGLLKQFIRLLKGIMRCLKFRDVKVDLNIGLTNPADTGQLFAIAMPVSLFLQSYAQEIKLQPSFTGPGIYGTACGTARIQPIRLTVPLANFVFSRPILKTAKILVTAKWTRRK
jgi:hypothetical protein